MNGSLLLWHEVLSDCFLFVRREFKQLFRYLIFCILFSGISLSVLYFVPSLEQSLLFFVGYLLMQILLLCGGLVFVNAVSEQRFLPPWKALATALPRLASFIGVSLLTGLLTSLGFILFIIPGIYLSARWMVADMCAVLAEKGPMDAMALSKALTADNILQLAVLVIINISLFLSLILVSFSISLEQNLIVDVLGSILSWMIYLFWIIVRYRCYIILKSQQHKGAA